MIDPRLRRFRIRILIAAGLMLASGPMIRAARAGGSTGGTSGSDGSSGGTSESGSSTATEGSSTATEGSSSTAAGSSSTAADGTAGGSAATTSTSTTDGTSTSTSNGDGTGAPFDPDDGIDCTGCYGRPYITEQRARVASLATTEAWRGEVGVPSLAEVDPAQRAALVELWTSAALSEHSSVAGFHRFALDLLAHGAPSELVMGAQRAAMEELEHARACFGLASAYAGRSIGPGPMPLGASAPIASTLEELAVWTVHEGCVGETVAAWLASEILEQSEDPAVRAVMAKIAEEEAAHAELAWATLRWALSVGGEVVRRAVADAFASARVSPPSHGTSPVPHHGLLSDAAVEEAVRMAFSQVVQPCADRLVAAA